MPINKSEKKELLEKLNMLLKKQSLFQVEINELQLEIATLQVDDLEEFTSATEVIETSQLVKETVQEENEFSEITELKIFIQNEKKESYRGKSGISAEIEKFIGENLINKVGIAVLIIGVGIGVKYAIDNDLISPLVRIILGYLVGFSLAGFAIRLKSKYLNFSAVLFSGAMAIQYFITYAAISYYNLFPQIVAISLMVVITILTVALALYYNQQVIAHFGLVGAYIVPYLLIEPFLNVTILFIYMAIINSGILYISTQKKWKPLYYLAFIATWTIFISWVASKNYNNQLGICLTFLGLFFLIFYLAFLSYKLLLKEKFRIDDVFFLLVNSGILFFAGFFAIDSLESSKAFLGLFVLIIAVVHAGIALLVNKTRLNDKNLFYWTIGLVIAFFTIAISVQFNNSVTAILWSFEAALIFWYGRSKKIIVYENISYFIVFITTLATASNWTSTSYHLYSNNIEKIFTPFLNIGFLTSSVVIISFIFIYYINLKSKNTTEINHVFGNMFNVVFPIVFLFILYFTIYTEISLYWNNVQIKASFEVTSDGSWEKQFDKLNFDIIKFRSVWLINYSLLFVSILSFINFRWFKTRDFSNSILILSSLLIITFIGSGLNLFAGLRTSYLNPALQPDYDVSINHLIIRYISIAFFAVFIYSIFRFIISVLKIQLINIIFETVLSMCIIWLFSSELINWLSLAGSTELYKHWLSILWGAFSLILVSYGIWKRKKHLRIFAIILFSGTLIKLFFYDLTNLETIPKTIVFLFIGILLLIVSFMYNKYTKIIFDEN
jgi:uncharacterized membrane protein